MDYFSTIRPPKAPNLPVGPVEYTQRYQDQLLNILRLYFNTIDNFAGQVINTDITPTDGTSLKFPHISASDTSDQYAGGNNTPTLVVWNTLEAGYGFTLNLDGSATALYSGVYKITFSLEFANTDNVQHEATVWLKLNGVDVPRSSTSFSLPARKSALIPTFVCGYSEVTFEVAAGQRITLHWATELAATSGGVTGVYIHADPAQTSPYVRPAIPSAVGSITFVSALTT